MIPEEDAGWEKVGWENCSWEGSRSAQLKAYRKLSFKEKLHAIESWCAFSRFLIERRRKRGFAVVPLRDRWRG